MFYTNITSINHISYSNLQEETMANLHRLTFVLARS